VPVVSIIIRAGDKAHCREEAHTGALVNFPGGKQTSPQFGDIQHWLRVGAEGFPDNRPGPDPLAAEPNSRLGRPGLAFTELIDW
jgi:hypothetical protein